MGKCQIQKITRKTSKTPHLTQIYATSMNRHWLQMIDLDGLSGYSYLLITVSRLIKVPVKLVNFIMGLLHRFRTKFMRPELFYPVIPARQEKTYPL